MQTVSHVWRVIEAWLDVVQFRPSQAQLAQSVGVARSAVSDWKSGKSKPTPEHVRSIAQLMTPTIGPTAYDQLVVALMADLGYITEQELEARLSQLGRATRSEHLGLLVSDGQGGVIKYRSGETDTALAEAANESAGDPLQQEPGAEEDPST